MADDSAPIEISDWKPAPVARRRRFDRGSDRLWGSKRDDPSLRMMVIWAVGFVGEANVVTRPRSMTTLKPRTPT